MATVVTDQSLIAKFKGEAPSAGKVVTDPKLLEQFHGDAYLHPDDMIGGDQTPGAQGNNPMAQASVPHRPAPAPKTLTEQLQDAGDNLSAGFTAGVNAIPIAGPTILSGLEAAKGVVQGRPQADVAATDQAQVEAHPTAATVGSVAGTVAPFVVGGAIPGVARALGMTGGLVSRAALGGLSGGAIAGADTAVRGGSAKDIAVSAAEGAGLGAVLPIVGKVVSGTVGKITGRATSPETANVARALASDNIDPTIVNSRLAQLGPDARVMDLGPNLQRQAGALASVPGPAQADIRGAVSARAAGASDRVTQDVSATIGNSPEIDALKQQIVDAQSAASKPIYDKVRNVPVDLAAFSDVFQTDMGKQALATAQKMLGNDIGTSPSTVNGPTIGLIDYAKQALDDVASAAIREGRKNEARQAVNLANILRNRADQIAPDYKAAREAFAGPAQVLDAIDAGTAAFTKDTTPAQLTNMLKTMTPSEQDAYLHGAQSWLEAQMGNAVNDPLALRNLFKKGWNEQKLRIMVGDEVANDLLGRIGREANYSQTAQVVAGNSETAARLAAQAEVAPELGRLPRPQGLVGLTFSLVDAARNFLHGYNQPKINRRMGQMLTSGALSDNQVRALGAASQGPRKAIVGPAGLGALGTNLVNGSLSVPSSPIAASPPPSAIMSLGDWAAAQQPGLN